MNKLVLVLLLLSLLTLTSAGRRKGKKLPTYEEVVYAQEKIQEKIAVDPQLMPNFIQLAFHECLGSHGCNGCLDLKHPGNKGLVVTVKQLKKLRKKIAPTMTQADFDMLCAVEAAKAGAAAANGMVDIPVKVGRQDCKKNPGDDKPPHGGITNTIQFLQSEFEDLSEKEVVALMGGHSFGRCKTKNSGFEGPWDRNEFALDPGYYLAMKFAAWKLERRDNRKTRSTQWSANDTVQTDGIMMLNADMILNLKFKTFGEYDTPDCDAESCELSETAQIIDEFAFNQVEFHKWFSSAFGKMISKSDFQLTELQPTPASSSLR